MLSAPADGWPPADRDHQPAHLPARPAGHRRRGRAQRLRGRGGQAAGQPRHRGGDLHPRGLSRHARRRWSWCRACWSATWWPARSRNSTRTTCPARSARSPSGCCVPRPTTPPAGTTWCTRTTGCPARSRRSRRSAGGCRSSSPCTPWARSRTWRWPAATAPSPRSGSAARARSWRPPTGWSPTPRKRRASWSSCTAPAPWRVETVSPGVDLSVFRAGPAAAARRRLGLPADAVVLVFAGRIQPLKGPDVVLRAAAELLRSSPALADRLVVVFVGGPSGSEVGAPGRLDGLAADARHLGLRPARAAVPAARAGRLVPGRDRGAGAVALGIVRAGGARGSGLRDAGGRGRRRRAAHRGQGRLLRHPGGRARSGGVGAGAFRAGRARPGGSRSCPAARWRTRPGSAGPPPRTG